VIEGLADRNVRVQNRDQPQSACGEAGHMTVLSRSSGKCRPLLPIQLRVHVAPQWALG
jgi:hypothetical protein